MAISSNTVNKGVTGNQDGNEGGFMSMLAEKKAKLDSFQANLAGAIMPSLPGMPAGKYQDIAIGVDAHPTTIPPCPVIPIPHIGQVFDIIGAIFSAISAALPPPPEPEPPPPDGEDPKPQPLTVSSVAVAIVQAMKPSVMVNNKFIANAGISIQHLPAIFLHAVPPVAPMASSEMFMGSATVLADGAPFSTQLHPALSCNLVGMPAPFRPKKPKAKITLMAPSSCLVTVIPGGKPVLVGGPPTIDLMSLGMGMGLKVFGKLAKAGKKAAGKFTKKVAGKAAKTAAGKAAKKASKKVGKVLKAAVDKLPISKARAQRWKDKICKTFGEPVDAATGRVFSENIDFILPGPIPLEWTRYYFSDCEMPSPIGSNWHHSYHIGYQFVNDDFVSLLLPDGREVVLPALAIGDEYFDFREKLSWFYDDSGLAYRDETGLTYHFNTSPDQKGFYAVSSIRNDLGFEILFEYDFDDNLYRIIDSAGRKINIENENDRITGIYTYNNGKKHWLIRYTVDREDNLSKVTLPNGAKKQFYYEGHLLVKLTNQSGLSFYWEYEGKGNQAKCVHTWGDEGILEYWIRYEKGKTIATNSLGHTTTYFYKDDKLIYQITDAKGGDSFTKYNEHQEVVLEMDPIGNTTKYTYDEWGNLIELEDAEQNKTTFEYDYLNRLVAYTSPEGLTMNWEFEDGKLVKRTFPNGSTSSYEYKGKLLTAIVDDEKQKTGLNWNSKFELEKVSLPDGRTVSWQYDDIAQLLQHKQPNGAKTKFKYDSSGNVIEFVEPDGNKHQFKYDAADNVIEAKDANRKVAFTYWGLGNLKTRKENGHTINFNYNTEEQLTSIINEHGEAYRFTLDPLGQIVGEWGFDGLQRRYVRDAAGRVTKILRPAERWTQYTYNGNSKILATEYYDGTGEYFSYNGDGNLTEASNEFATVKLSYEKGNLVLESQNGYTVNSEHNNKGQRVKISSSLGADITHQFRQNGELKQMKAGEWEAQFEHDKLGLEINRTVSGGINFKTQRDQLGRVTKHAIQAKNVEGRRVSYQWGKGDRLMSINNELTGQQTEFGYDETGNLQWANYNGLETIYKMPDAVGNLFKTKNREDRKYSEGGKLLKDDKATYEYDEEGNLTKRTVFAADNDKQLGEWNYHWLGNGMLQCVERPDDKVIIFEYDALGRRTAKIVGDKVEGQNMEKAVIVPTNDKQSWKNLFKTKKVKTETKNKPDLNKIKDGLITRFVWDGNVPLHEWQYPTKDRPELLINEAGMLEENRSEEGEVVEELKGLITWIFDEGTFKPTAKIVDGEQYSIITDYLGTPVEMYNSQGKKTWQLEYDIYGKIRTLVAGSLNDCPFRYQGMYFDEETELCYNRFRYYSPDSGTYISQDPIGLAGSNPNFYAYTKDNNIWVDVFGLDCKAKAKAKRNSSTSFGGETVRGFKNGGEIMERLGNLRNRLRQNGFPNAEVGLRGSSITGQSSKGAGEFFSNPKADLDFFVVDDVFTSKMPLDGSGSVKSKYLDESINEILDDFGSESTSQLGRKSSVRFIDSGALKSGGKYIKF